MRDVEPAVVRVLDMPATTTLPELHNLFQAAFGWWDYHLHQFDAADGVRLTPAGRLPRAIVREVQQSYPGWHPTGKPAATEDDPWPLAELHALLRRVGLLRLRNGVLAPTKAAADDLQVVRRLRSDFDPQAFGTKLIELTAALLASRGGLSVEELTAS